MRWDDIFQVVVITVSAIVLLSAFAVMFYYLIKHLKIVRRAKNGDVAAQQLLAKIEAERAVVPQSTDDDTDYEYCLSNIHNPCTIRGRWEAIRNYDDR